MAQGCNKTKLKGTNAMFVMTHDEIRHALANKKFFTYANPVVDYRPQKEDPHRIRITAGGNLINYEGNASVRTADIDTAKIHWNSVISTPNAKYMCLYIKKFYLTAALEYFEYMKIPLELFPEWTQEQYNLKELALEGWVYIEMRREYGAYLKPAFSPTSASAVNLRHSANTKAPTHRDCGHTNPDPYPSPSLSMTLVLNM